MRGWLLLLTFAGCETAEDFPSAPGPLEWSVVRRVPVDGKLQDTGYRIEIPQGVTVREVTSGERAYEMGSFSVHVRLEQPAGNREDFLWAVGITDRAQIARYEVHDNGWIVVANGGRAVYAATYVDDGAFTCAAEAGADVAPGKTTMLEAICRSLRATTAIAHPMEYPAGMSPREMRAAACKAALDRVRSLEPTPPKSRKKKTPQQVAAEKRDAAELDVVYARRQQTCEQRRWSEAALRCLASLAAPTGSDCVDSW